MLFEFEHTLLAASQLDATYAPCEAMTDVFEVNLPQPLCALYNLLSTIRRQF
jgi:hypothetical protein